MPVFNLELCRLDNWNLHSFDAELLWGEWEAVVRAQGLATWDDYRSASRAGRGTPLSVKDRKTIWGVMEEAQRSLDQRGALDWPGLCHRARALLQEGSVMSSVDAVIVDEVQDLGPQELQFLAALAGIGVPGREDRPASLALVGDGGQRIYSRATSLKALGIDVRGRSHVLRLNYRTSEQIRRFADHIIQDSADDLEGGRAERHAVRSLFNGPQPAMRQCASGDEQNRFVVETIGRLLAEGLQPAEIAVFARRNEQLKDMRAVLRAARLPCVRLGGEESMSPDMSGITLASMHRAKGLEYKVVFVVSVSDDSMPEPKAYKGLTDLLARDEAVQRERQLLYVSVTRARDELFLSWFGEASRFLQGVVV